MAEGRAGRDEGKLYTAGYGCQLKSDRSDFHLPKELIAQRPADRRDGSRLMVLPREGGAVQHRRFPDLDGCLKEGDVLVLNDTKVVPARVPFRRSTGGSVEALLVRQQGHRL